MRRVLLAIAAIALATPRASAQDPNAVLQRMCAAYAAARTYTQMASSTMTVTVAGRKKIGGLTNELRFARPNRIYVSVTNPQSGVTTASSDGRSFVGYRSATNMYRKAPAPRAIADFAAPARSVGIICELDPMYFLLGKKPEMTAVQSKGTAAVNGVACDVVTGRFTPQGMTKPGVGVATLYIDRGSSMLRKVVLALNGGQTTVVTRQRQGNKVVPVQRRVAVDQTIVTVIQQFKVNAAVPDSAFTFTPPAGAVEQKG